MQKLLIDTDPGQDIDDLLAILFALLRPELDVRALTTVTFPTGGRVRLVKRLLRHLGRGDIPVAAGEDFPLRPFSGEELARQRNLGTTMNHACFAEPEEEADAPDGRHAVDLIIDTVEAHPGEVALACIAPLTNIALALRRKPDLAGKIPYIAMMGGEMAEDRREHNAAFDYTATDLVLRSGIPIYMGTWSVTRRFAFPMEACGVFHRDGSPLGRALGEALRAWHPAQNWKPGPVMYDFFPMVWAFDRSLYSTRPLSIEVETADPDRLGRTLARGNHTHIEATDGLHEEALAELFWQTIRPVL